LWWAVGPATDTPDTAVSIATGDALFATGFMSSTVYMPLLLLPFCDPTARCVVGRSDTAASGSLRSVALWLALARLEVGAAATRLTLMFGVALKLRVPITRKAALYEAEPAG
jgi:hypothetical protein